MLKTSSLSVIYCSPRGLQALDIVSRSSVVMLVVVSSPAHKVVCSVVIISLLGVSVTGVL